MNIPDCWGQGFRVVRRGKLAGPGWHYGFHTPFGTVMEISHQSPVRLVTYGLFAQSKLVEFERKLLAHEIEPATERMNTALRLSPPYDISANNCEQLARWVAFGEHSCMQFQSLAVVGALAVGIVLLNDG